MNYLLIDCILEMEWKKEIYEIDQEQKSNNILQTETIVLVKTKMQKTLDKKIDKVDMLLKTLQTKMEVINIAILFINYKMYLKKW